MSKYSAVGAIAFGGAIVVVVANILATQQSDKRERSRQKLLDHIEKQNRRTNGGSSRIDSLLQELPQLSVDDFEDMLHLYSDKTHTLEELADIYNISTRYVATILQAYGVRVSLPARKSLM